jgi:hypothetical protein
VPKSIGYITNFNQTKETKQVWLQKKACNEGNRTYKHLHTGHQEYVHSIDYIHHCKQLQVLNKVMIGLKIFRLKF